MSVYISKKLRTSIYERAMFRCEYCKIYEKYAHFPFHIEHVLSLKHQGKSDFNNLALACKTCNLSKGTDVATFIESIDNLFRFYNPRTDNWVEHFSVENNGLILPISDIGKATSKILNLNYPNSVLEREELIKLGIF